MGHVHYLGVIATTLLFFADAHRAEAHEQNAAGPKHRRQATVTTLQLPNVSATPTPGAALATIYPSPGASPVLVTEQSQLVTSFVPQFTLCELPPIMFSPITAPPASQTTASWETYSIIVPTGNGSCTTVYSETETMICSTVLSDLTTTYTVSQCAQDITFSTDFGYTLVQPTSTGAAAAASSAAVSPAITAPPSIQTLTTYYLAPWQSLTSAGPPGVVDYKVCSSDPNSPEHCVLEYYDWKTSLVTIVSTTVTSINLTTTIPGPSQLLVETFIANVTGQVTTFSMSTTMELETSVLSESTISSTRPVSTGPTMFETKTVELASSSGPPTTSTMTTTLRLTLTTLVGTSTVTLTPAILPTSVSDVLPSRLPPISS